MSFVFSHVEYCDMHFVYGFCDGNALLYGRETCSLTLREECRLRVFGNRVLRRVFWRKRDEVTGEWRKLHNEELSDLYSLPNIMRVVKSRRMRWAGHVEHKGRWGAQGSGGET